MKTAAPIFLSLTVLGGALAAQSPAWTIVSSVKPSLDPEEGIKGASTLRGDTFRMANTPLSGVLMVAYGTPATRVIGAPAWVDHDRWDVEIKVQRPQGSPAPRTRDVVQAMLRERFKLDAAMEKRPRPIYALRTGREGAFGPNLTRSAFECDQRDFTQMKGLQERGVKGAHGQIPCATQSVRGTIAFAGLPLSNILPFIPADRVVQDQTGITGPVDLKLTWTYADDPVADQASLYSAVRDQLGLKLEPATAPLDVLVITSVSKPAAN